ncbi:radical SAM protein [Microbacterium sp. SORGH_AS_0421]|uniref:radical SAM protein n=1 Tax=Microbacterium sp. SORGH_AS_0421 TaxID=3041768 RepID=UPI00279026D7|nr:radical SAM protein [Microbacterium sp. SORGH_AS_0421]MDQ1177770.1 uncharacterized protein [Microbacterium sp. SORGH_AS_0421]
MLTEAQKEIIERVDRPNWGGYVAKNPGEDSVSIRKVGDRLLVFRALDVDAPGGGVFVYFPASGKTIELTRRQVTALQVDEPISDDQLDGLFPGLKIETIPASGWVLPNVPVDSPTENLRSRTLVLNPTEQCNIRCTYCYYGGAYEGTRNHQTLEPSADDLETAIREFLVDEKRVIDSQQAIYFFGGEPLLGFKKMEQAMAVINERRREVGTEFPKLILQVNTNGMLLNDKIMQFLVDNDIYMNVSIDGPNHDLYRIDRRGKGTHDRVRAKIEWVADRWPDYFARRVAIICVLSQPLDTRKMYQYFAEWDVAQRALAWDFDLVLPGGSGSYDEFQQLFDEQDKIWDLFVSAHINERTDRERSFRFHYAFSHGFLHRSFHRALNQKQKIEDPARVDNLLGVQLVPGSEYLVLGADGTYYTSYEYQAAEFATGTVATGVDYSIGMEQLSSFADGAQTSSCSSCWAVRMCTVNFPEAPFARTDSSTKTEQKAAAKVARCRSERTNLRKALEAVQEIEMRFGADRLDEHREDWVQQKELGPSIEGFNE